MGADIAVGSTQRFRRAPGLRRAACRLHGLPRRVQAQHAGPDRRRVHRRAGQQGLPPRAPDPRAAHPAREGDVERLHRAGASGQHRLVLRGVPRPRGPQGHRPAHPPQDRPARAGARGRGLHRRARVLLRHLHGGGRRASGRHPRGRAAGADQLPQGGRHEDRDRGGRDDPPRRPRRRLAGLRPVPHPRRLRRGLPPRARGTSCGRPPTSPTRCST
jgi:hypothetical protein